MNAWAKKIAADNTYHYVKWDSNDVKTKQCPICRGFGDGKYKGFNCIRFGASVWKHGGNLPCKCEGALISNGVGEQMYKASDSEALSLAKNALGINDIVVIRNKNGIPKNQWEAGDLCLKFNNSTYEHMFYYMGDNQIADAGNYTNINNQIAIRSADNYSAKIIVRYVGWNKPEPVPQKSIEELAQEVLDGKWGSGEERKQRLIAAGYDYDAVQAKVNEILAAKKTIDELAQEVLDGKWGSGEDRKKRLIEAGYDYDAIQKRVNELLATVTKELEACAAQADWMRNSTYAWESNPTVAKSKKKGTCVTYVACVLQRIGLLPSGSYVWHDEGKVYGNNSKMTIIYPGNKTLSQLKSQLKAGDIIIDGDKHDNGSGSHIFILTGQWSGNNPIIWDNHSAQDKGGKSYTYTRNRSVIAIIRPKYSLIPATKTIDELAQEVLDGKWGSGQARKEALISAGYDYDAVQNKVNELLANQAPVKITYPGILPTTALQKTNAEVINDACKWASWIAGDNRFHYGYTNKHGSSDSSKWNPNAHHNGCYFCGTNTTSGGRSKKGIVDYERTYCCNPFVGAAWAHGGCVPKALSLCQSGSSWDYHKGKGYDSSSLFTNLGKPAKSSLKKGDVCCNDSHVFLYLGNGKLAEASSGDDNVRNSSKWNNSIHIADLTDSKYKSVKRVHRFNSSVNTTAIIRHGEVSNRVAQWQAFLDWLYDGQVGSADGIFGDNTLAWTKKFQEEYIGQGQGDGLIGEKTLAAAAAVKK